MKKHIKWIIPLCAVAIVAVIAIALRMSSPIIHKSAHVTVKKVGPSEKTNTSLCTLMLPLEEERLFRDHTLIVKGVVKNIREAEVSYTDYGREKTKYVTLFDFRVTEYLKNSSSVKEKRVLTLGHSLSSYEWVTGAHKLTEGEECILFCHVFADDSEPEPLYTHEYTDAWVRDPVTLIMPRNGDTYKVNPSFAPFVRGTNPGGNSVGSFNPSVDVFENYIRKKANDDQ